MSKKILYIVLISLLVLGVLGATVALLDSSDGGEAYVPAKPVVTPEPEEPEATEYTLSGTYVFLFEPYDVGEVEQNIVFSSAGVEYTSMKLSDGNVGFGDEEIYDNASEEWMLSYQYMVVDFGSKSQSVSKSYYQKFTKIAFPAVYSTPGLVFEKGTSTGDNNYYDCIGTSISNLTSIVVGNIYNGLPVRYIGSDAFCDYESLTEIVIHSSSASGYRSSGAYYSFKGCSALKKVVLADSVQSISSYGFRALGNVSELTIGQNVRYIADCAFQNNSLTTLVIPDSVISIGSSAFGKNENLKSVYIGSGVTSIDSYAFNNNSLTDIYYAGSADQWYAITFGTDAIPSSTVIHYEVPAA